MVALLALSVAWAGQNPGPPDYEQSNLDPATKPLAPLAFFAQWQCVTVCEIPAQKEIEQKYPIRVFRYTVRQDFDALSKSWQSSFPKSEGWERDKEMDSPVQFCVERLLKNSKVRRQAIIFSKSKAVFDRTAFVFTRFERVPGWIRASFNEEYVSKPPPAKVLKRWSVVPR